MTQHKNSCKLALSERCHACFALSLAACLPPSCCALLPPSASYNFCGHCPRAEPCRNFLRVVHCVPAAPFLHLPRRRLLPPHGFMLSPNAFLAHVSHVITLPQPSMPTRQKTRSGCLWALPGRYRAPETDEPPPPHTSYACPPSPGAVVGRSGSGSSGTVQHRLCQRRRQQQQQ